MGAVEKTFGFFSMLDWLNPVVSIAKTITRRKDPVVFNNVDHLSPRSFLTYNRIMKTDFGARHTMFHVNFSGMHEISMVNTHIWHSAQTFTNQFPR